MSQIERAVRQARSRLTANRWLDQVCVTLATAAGIFAAISVLVRLFDVAWPLGMLAAGLVIVAVGGSIIWALLTRVDLAGAAVALDRAAGLKERISSGMYCSQGSDPFEKAVFADAERTGGQLHVASHLRWQAPRRLGGALTAALVAAATLLIPRGLLAGDEATTHTQQDTVRTAAVVKQRTEDIKKAAKTNPELKALAEELEALGEVPDQRNFTPTDIRHAALKKLDQMQDILKQQKGKDEFKNAQELKKMLRALNPSETPDTPVKKLTQALAQGDFKAARDQLQQMQEQLAKLTDPADAQKLDSMKNQLDELAKKLESLAKAEDLEKQLQQSGIKKEDIERMLKQLSKKDLEQLREQLEKQGMSQKDIEKLAKQLQQQAGARQMAQNLAKSMQQAGQAAGEGNPQQAIGQMQGAADQLSEMEMLEQELSQMDSMIADLQDAKNDMGNPCGQCRGTGMEGKKPCGQCSGSGTQGGGGMGSKMQRGQGGIAREEHTPADFVKRREKVKTGRGAIVGQYLVDADQIRGEVTSSAHEIVTAAERDAAEAINRARIPRRYHQSVKRYFSDLQEKLDREKGESKSSGTADDDSRNGDLKNGDSKNGNSSNTP